LALVVLAQQPMERMELMATTRYLVRLHQLVAAVGKDL
jgi:hypothetical protein